MARKFNIGRQGEQLLNEEWHGLFMSLKYLNYDRYKDIETVMQERQTEIPDHALRIRSREGLDLLQTYYPTIGDGVWKNLFEGHYHPASAIKPDQDTNIAPYQLCIDPKTGAIMYWDANNKSWMIARANEYTGALDSFNGMNYQYISPLKLKNDFYPVPYVPYGKLFSDINFVSDYANENNCGVTPDADVNTDNLTWIHVNASKLVKVDRRFIEIPKDIHKPDYGFIGITSLQTEFYLFKEDHRGGHLLRKEIIQDDGTKIGDFVDVMGGIQLNEEVLNDPTNKYIYSITYTFDESPSNEGRVYSKKGSVTGDNQVYIGQVSNDEYGISLFMDGLSLEQTDEFDNTIYDYDPVEGTVTFTDDNDAEIINQMQMSTLLFPKRTADFTISNKGANVNSTEKTVTVEVGNNIDSWQTPMVFCSGLGLQETEIFEDVIVNGSSVTIKDFVLPGDEIVKGYVADVGNSFVCKGVLDKPYIIDDKIKAGEEYAVFVNGILLTPTNMDISVDDGRIDINNAEDVEFDNLDYVVFNIDDADDTKIALVFDESVSYHSIRIDDEGNSATYNDCNCALLYIGSSLLLDQAAVEKPINPVEGYYKGGQIIKATDLYGNYTYYKYDYTEKEPVPLSEQQAAEVEAFIAYYATTGSIHLVGDNEEFKNCEYVYYAYNFANMIDEVTITGSKTDLAINIGEGNDIYNGAAGRLEAWPINCNSLSTYINGLMIENTEIEPNEGVTRRYSITYPKLNLIQTDYYGERNLLYALNSLYNIYINKINEYKNNPDFANASEARIKSRILNDEDISTWNIDENETAKNYFHSKSLSKDALELAIYIHEDMQHEYTSYAIEKIERDEFVAAHRDFVNLEGNGINEHQQIYRATQDTIEADFLLAPGTVNIYLNGQLLAYEDYCKFNNNKIMFNVDVCGLQQLPAPEKMLNCLPDYLSASDRFDYEQLFKKKQMIRLIEDIPYYIPTTSRDTILVEKRNDMSIKSVTYDVLVTSYNSFEFTKDYYDMPDSLMNTTDFIKIYINGIYYDEGYVLTNTGGIKGIKLTGDNALTIDPLYEYFNRNPEKAEEYLQTYGEKYQRKIDKITFEWR